MTRDYGFRYKDLKQLRKISRVSGVGVQTIIKNAAIIMVETKNEVF
jgi:hypothetical protein